MTQLNQNTSPQFYADICNLSHAENMAPAQLAVYHLLLSTMRGLDNVDKHQLDVFFGRLKAIALDSEMVEGVHQSVMQTFNYYCYGKGKEEPPRAKWAI